MNAMKSIKMNWIYVVVVVVITIVASHCCEARPNRGGGGGVRHRRQVSDSAAATAAAAGNIKKHDGPILPRGQHQYRRGRRLTEEEETTIEVDQYPYPRFRYTPWDSIPSQHVDWALDLGYDSDGFEWDFYNESAVEELDYTTLTRNLASDGDDDAIAALNGFGYTSSVWDCWINHYDNYDWEEYIEYEFVDTIIALGWTEGSWNGTLPPPESNSKPWANLTLAEQEAADSLCYFEEIWDNIPLDEWGTSTPSSSPSFAPSVDGDDGSTTTDGDETEEEESSGGSWIDAFTRSDSLP